MRYPLSCTSPVLNVETSLTRSHSLVSAVLWDVKGQAWGGVARRKSGTSLPMPQAVWKEKGLQVLQC